MQRKHIGLAAGLIFAGFVTSASLAGGFEITRHTIDGGGGASAGGAFTLTGTIGQPDAGPISGAMIGGVFSLVGGFWPGAVDDCSSLGDMNGDGPRDGADIQAFVNCVLTGNGPCACADMDGGGVHVSDVAAFVAALLG
jgi:hypothetical protein